MWTIYFDPSDHPGVYVAREFKITREGPVPSPFASVSPTLEHAREGISEGRVCLPRSEDDDPVIVESWI